MGAFRRENRFEIATEQKGDRTALGNVEGFLCGLRLQSRLEIIPLFNGKWLVKISSARGVRGLTGSGRNEETADGAWRILARKPLRGWTREEAGC